MYKRIFFFFGKLVDENELGSDQRNYTFMRIDINLRLKINGIDASLNHIIATKLKTQTKRKGPHIYFLTAKTYLKPKAALAKPENNPQKNSSWKESVRLPPNSISQRDYRLNS